MTYRNSCLAVLVGDVGKSSSLQMKIQEKAGKQKGSKYTHPKTNRKQMPSIQDGPNRYKKGFWEDVNSC